MWREREREREKNKHSQPIIGNNEVWRVAAVFFLCCCCHAPAVVLNRSLSGLANKVAVAKNNRHTTSSMILCFARARSTRALFCLPGWNCIKFSQLFAQLSGGIRLSSLINKQFSPAGFSKAFLAGAKQQKKKEKKRCTR